MSAAHAAHRSRTVLAFDFGTKFIGVAVGDTGSRIAHALAMLEASGSAARLARIDALVREWEPAELLVGLPLAGDGAEQPMSVRARRFSRQLAARYSLPVTLADERFTSASARESLRAEGHPRRGFSERVQSEAARILLQGWFDDRAASGR